MFCVLSAGFLISLRTFIIKNPANFLQNIYDKIVVVVGHKTNLIKTLKCKWFTFIYK